MELLRLTMTTEFPRAAVEVVAHRFTLCSRITGSVEGTGVVCVDSRYASVLWRGAGRLERLHAPPATWKVLDLALSHLQPGQNAPAEATELLSQGRQVEVVCESVHPITAPPFDVVAALDALFCAATE